MTVRYDGGVIRIEGECGVEQAEPLLELLLAHPDAAIDWSDCRRMHTALVQVLLAAHRPVRGGPPADPVLRRWVAPLLAGPARDGGRPADGV